METRYQTQPLTKTERDHLLMIYNSRLRVFAPAFLVLTLFAIYLSLGYAAEGNIKHEKDIFPLIPQAYFNFLFVGAPLMFLALLIYRRRVHCFKADAKNGLKEMMPYEIIEKEYFPYTDQYYFKIDNPDNMHFEVDQEQYNSYHQGDTIYIPRAPKSKYTFEYGGRFSLM